MELSILIYLKVNILISFHGPGYENEVPHSKPVFLKEGSHTQIPKTESPEFAEPSGGLTGNDLIIHQRPDDQHTQGDLVPAFRKQYHPFS